MSKRSNQAEERASITRGFKRMKRSVKPKVRYVLSVTAYQETIEAMCESEQDARSLAELLIGQLIGQGAVSAMEIHRTRDDAWEKLLVQWGPT